MARKTDDYWATQMNPDSDDFGRIYPPERNSGKVIGAQVVQMVSVRIGRSTQLLTLSEADTLYDCMRAALQDGGVR